MLRPPFRPTQDVKVDGTVYADLDTLEYSAENGDSRWRYVDIEGTACLLLESKAPPVRFKSRGEVQGFVHKIVRKAVKTEEGSPYPPSFYVEAHALENGDKMWEGTLRLDTHLVGDRILSESAFWRDFRFWTDGRETMIWIGKQDGKPPDIRFMWQRPLDNVKKTPRLKPFL